MNELKSFLDQIKGDAEQEENTIFVLTYLLAQGLSWEDIEKLPLIVFLNLLKNFDKIIKLKGI